MCVLCEFMCICVCLCVRVGVCACESCIATIQSCERNHKFAKLNNIFLLNKVGAIRIVVKRAATRSSTQFAPTLFMMCE